MIEVIFQRLPNFLPTYVSFQWTSDSFDGISLRAPAYTNGSINSRFLGDILTLSTVSRIRRSSGMSRGIEHGARSQSFHVSPAVCRPLVPRPSWFSRIKSAPASRKFSIVVLRCDGLFGTCIKRLNAWTFACLRANSTGSLSKQSSVGRATWIMIIGGHCQLQRAQTKPGTVMQAQLDPDQRPVAPSNLFLSISPCTVAPTFPCLW
ncbi:hypothetical protein B0T18DRAFT_246987 [Schizothecium vesticola]|uniref:Uncharacterized protein n=1 Tax=Schizothecium vesticola TaxID=314040 RepID=A0AA40BQK8_9PEZI|nr:hypothetical protein B0T18DRAFT_246987 [Schizothecium vesticola]